MSVKSIVVLVLLGLFSFVYAVAANIPANLVLAEAVKQTRAFSYQGASGTIWDATVAAMQVRHEGQTIELGKAQWQIHPSVLLLAQLEADISLSHGERDIAATVAVSASQQLSIDDASFKFPIEQVSDFYPIPILIEGEINGNIEHASINLSSQSIDQLEGSIAWMDAAADIGSGLSVLGSFGAKLSGQDGQIAIAVDDIKGEIGLSGNVQFDSTQRRYNLDLALTPKPGLEPGLAGMIRTLGPLNAQGAIPLQYAGRL